MERTVRLNRTLREHLLLARNRNLARRLLARADGREFLWRVYCSGILIRESERPYAVGESLTNSRGEYVGSYRITDVDFNSRVCLAQLQSTEFATRGMGSER